MAGHAGEAKKPEAGVMRRKGAGAGMTRRREQGKRHPAQSI